MLDFLFHFFNRSVLFDTFITVLNSSDDECHFFVLFLVSKERHPISYSYIIFFRGLDN